MTKLVMGQLKASKKDVKAILLVGGFGQSAYLRGSIHKEVMSALSAKTEVIQSPNQYKRQWNAGELYSCLCAYLVMSILHL